MNIKNTALRRALSILDSLNAVYYIVTADGEVHGELPEKRKQPRPAKVSYLPLYKQALDTLDVGHVITLQAEDGIDPERLRCATQAAAILRFGKGSTIGSRKGNKIEFLRVY